MSTVETRETTKLFGNVCAVDSVALKAEEGEFLVLLGPSGCGKSTLMRMIAGIEDPTRSDVVIGERIVTDLLNTRRTSRTTIHERVNWAAEMFRFQHLLRWPPNLAEKPAMH